MATGRPGDAETNLDHTQFRQNSSTLGRWMTPDPAGLSRCRANLYRFLDQVVRHAVAMVIDVQAASVRTACTVPRVSSEKFKAV
jgi:hypothetical protein